MPLVMVHSISIGIFIITTVVKYLGFMYYSNCTSNCSSKTPDMYAVCMLPVFLSRLMYTPSWYYGFIGWWYVRSASQHKSYNTFPHWKPHCGGFV